MVSEAKSVVRDFVRHYVILGKAGGQMVEAVTLDASGLLLPGRAPRGGGISCGKARLAGEREEEEAGPEGCPCLMAEGSSTQMEREAMGGF